MQRPSKRITSRSVTMKDVARVAGVSQPTVSRALNNTSTSIVVGEARAAITWPLTERDYETVGQLGVPDSYPPGPRRYRGYGEALEEAGRPRDPRFIFKGDFSLESGRRAARAA